MVYEFAASQLSIVSARTRLEPKVPIQCPWLGETCAFIPSPSKTDYRLVNDYPTSASFANIKSETLVKFLCDQNKGIGAPALVLVTHTPLLNLDHCNKSPQRSAA